MPESLPPGWVPCESFQLTREQRAAVYRAWQARDQNLADRLEEFEADCRRLGVAPDGRSCRTEPGER